MKAFILLLLTVVQINCQINWQVGDWAKGCQFLGNDLSNVSVTGSLCSTKCSQTNMCTHYTWINGTCFMKKGSVNKTNAVFTSNSQIVCGLVQPKVGVINWQDGDWAMACDFKGNDLSNAKTIGALCKTKCLNTWGCTHYTWTNYNGGTCWMKKGPVNKANAIFTGDYQAVCGFYYFPPVPNGALLWSDEFNYNGPVSAKWEYEIGSRYSGWGNNEKQYYTNTNGFAKNGYLTVVAKKENLNGFNYTSSRLISKKQFKYGVFEIKAKLPKGRGLMSAFWLLGTDNSFGIWPAVGEIDILENPGFEANRIFGTIHCKAYNHMNGNSKGSNVLVDNVYDNFHIYRLDWNKNRLKWYVDDRLYFTYQNDYKGDRATWPYDYPMKLIINTSVGGNWEGSKGIDHSIFPANYVIDYVRQYAPNNVN